MQCLITQRTPTGKRSADGTDVTDPSAPRIHIVSAMPTKEYARNVEFTTQSHDLRAVLGGDTPPPASAVSFGIRRIQSITNFDPPSSSTTLIIGAGACVALAGVVAAAFLVWKRRQAGLANPYSQMDDLTELEQA